jgi:AcrR family transcriptional regulator
MTTTVNTAERILDCALELAERSSWEAVRLYDVAVTAGLTLDEIRTHFRDKENLIEAWFDRADAAMLRSTASPGFLQLSTRERLQWLIMTWFQALAPHRRVTRQMILGKCEPGHLHVQIPAVMRISRTVQWMREASQRDATYVHRALEETALTSIYLATFIHWMADDSPDSERTRRLLDTLLRGAEKAANGFSALSALLRSRSAGPSIGAP